MSNAKISRLSAPHYLTLCASLIGSLAIGCADLPEAEDVASEHDDSAEPAVRTDALFASDLKEPSGAYFAKVKANGTGCPAGSWDTSISSDGKTFTTTFSKYVADVDPKTTVSVKDCQLTVTLHSPQGLSFAVQEFAYGGYAFLEKGVNLRQVAQYYFSGSPDKSAEARTEIDGPKDDTFLFTDTIKEASLVFAPCGVERDLNIRTTMRLLNGTPAKTGKVIFSAVDGSVKLKFRLSWRKCDEKKDEKKTDKKS